MALLDSGRSTAEDDNVIQITYAELSKWFWGCLIINKNSFFIFSWYSFWTVYEVSNFHTVTDGKADTCYSTQLSIMYPSENKPLPLSGISTQDHYSNIEPKIITVVPSATVQLRDWRNGLCAFLSMYIDIYP